MRNPLTGKIDLSESGGLDRASRASRAKLKSEQEKGRERKREKQNDERLAKYSVC